MTLAHFLTTTLRPPRFLIHLARPLLYFASAYSSISLFLIYGVTYTWSSGPSMYPTLPATTDSLTIISRLHRKGRGVKVGDIVEADSPLFIGAPLGKRVLGLPGDYVVLDQDAEASVGGAAVEDVTVGSVGRDGRREQPRMIQVPEGHVWVAGDNMAWSRDSRFYGPLPMALIRGKIVAAGTGPFNLIWMGRDQLREVED